MSYARGNNKILIFHMGANRLALPTENLNSENYLLFCSTVNLRYKCTPFLLCFKTASTCFINYRAAFIFFEYIVSYLPFMTVPSSETKYLSSEFWIFLSLFVVLDMLFLLRDSTDAFSKTCNLGWFCLLRWLYQV